MCAARPCAQPDSVAAISDALVAASGARGTTSARSFALGASTVEADQVQPGPGYQRGQALHELQRRHHDVRGAIAPGRLQFEHALPCRVALHALVGQRGPRDVAAQLLKCLEDIGGAAQLITPTTGRYMHVPYRCMLPQRVRHLLVTGRAIGGDRIAHAATPNMACCAFAGQGAGIAAAQSIKSGKGFEDVDIGKLQAELTRRGVRYT